MAREIHSLISDTESTAVYISYPNDFEDKRYIITSDEKKIAVSRREWDILEFLVSRPGELIPSREIIAALWPGFSGRRGLDVLRVNVKRARQRLDKVYEGFSENIEIVHNKGYRWKDSAFVPINPHPYIATDHSSLK